MDGELSERVCSCVLAALWYLEDGQEGGTWLGAVGPIAEVMDLRCDIMMMGLGVPSLQFLAIDWRVS